MDAINYTVISTDAEGNSYFEDRVATAREAEYVPGIPLVGVGEPVLVDTLTICRCDARYVSDWHPPPRRQFVVIL